MFGPESRAGIGFPGQPSPHRAAEVFMLGSDDQGRLLGPLEVTVGGERLALRGRPRELLAKLALTPQRTVSYDDLCDAVWDNEWPVHPRDSLFGVVRRLRQLVGPAHVVQASGGYHLQIPERNVDLFQFRTLVAQARSEGERAGDAEAELGFLNDALRLWRGPILADVRSPMMRRHQVPRITEEWLSALERRQDLWLAVGRHDEVIREIPELTAGHPLRESLWARLMMALHQADRQADAFAVYGDIRTLLRDELGSDPGAELTRAYQVVLRAGSTRSKQVAPIGEPAVAATPRELPGALRHFVGRGAELDALEGLAAHRSDFGLSIAVITGSAGMGKTALAVHWASRAAKLLPGGQLYVNLRGFGPLPPMDVHGALNDLLRALGVPAKEIPADTAAASNLLRSRTAGRRMLILLDNALDSEQVRPLLPGSGCLALITSRNQLRGLVARDAAVRIGLAPLGTAESARLLAQIVGDRVTVEPEAAARPAELCDRMPLALRILAERIARQPGTTLAEFAHDLRGRHDRLDLFDVADDPATNLRTVLSWSYVGLDDAAARMFRLVGGVHPGGDISLAAAAAAAGVPDAVARDLLDRLVATHLVAEHRSGRYQLHDLVRAFAAEQTARQDGCAERDEAVRRILDWYLYTADRADRALEPNRMRAPLDPSPDDITPLAFDDVKTAAEWFGSEYSTLVVLPAWAFAEGANRHACRLAYSLVYFVMGYNARYRDLLATHEVALGAAVKLQDLHFECGRLVAAIACWRRAVEINRRAGSRWSQIINITNLGRAYAALGQHRKAIRYYGQALAIADDMANRRSRVNPLVGAGRAQLAVGDVRAARESWREAVATLESLADARAAEVRTELAAIEHAISLPPAERPVGSTSG
jgi:DNA-binding SARP family transcriptional activator/tetratricopeptide (TPR) repeat protein